MSVVIDALYVVTIVLLLSSAVTAITVGTIPAIVVYVAAFVSYTAWVVVVEVYLRERK